VRIEFKINKAQYRIEIRFSEEPGEQIKAALASHEFRYHTTRGFWYAPVTQGRIIFAKELLVQWLSDSKKARSEYLDPGINGRNKSADEPYKNNAYTLLKQLIPAFEECIQKSGNETTVDINTSSEEKWHVTIYKKEIHDGIHTIVLTDTINGVRHLQYDVDVNPLKQEAYVTAEWLSFFYQKLYGRPESEGEIEEGDGDLKEELTKTMSEWITDLIRQKILIANASSKLPRKQPEGSDPYPLNKKIEIPIPPDTGRKATLEIKKGSLDFSVVVWLMIDTGDEVNGKVFELSGHKNQKEAFHAGVQKAYNYLACYSSPSESSAQKVIRSVEAYAKKEGISLTGNEDVTTATPLTSFEHGLRIAMWNKYDEEHPINKASISGALYDIIRIERFVLDEFAKLPDDIELSILGKMKNLFRERESLERHIEYFHYENEAENKAAGIRNYLHEMMTYNDVLYVEKYYPLLTWLLRLLMMNTVTPITKQVVDSEDPNVLDLYEAEWQESNQEGDKVIINEIEYDKDELQRLILVKIAQLPPAQQNEIVSRLKGRFPEKKSIAEINASYNGPQSHRETSVVQEYVTSMLWHDDEHNVPVTTFLIDVLRGKVVPTKAEEELSATEEEKRNSQIEMFLFHRDDLQADFTVEEKAFLKKYTAHTPAANQVPPEIIHFIWICAGRYGFRGGLVLDPSCGKGDLFEFAPATATVVGYESNPYAASIAQIRFPNATIIKQPFESLFYDGNRHLKDQRIPESFELVIGHLPTKRFIGKYAGMGEKEWTKAELYSEYCIRRSLDVIKPGGFLIFLITPNFLKGVLSPVKKAIAERIDFLISYRLEEILPDTDILILKKSGRLKR
jgi:hypothetical protein